MKRIALLLIGIAFSSFAFSNAEEPAGLFLTWVDNPYSSIVIDYHTLPGFSESTSISFRETGTVKWKTAKGEMFPYPHSDRSIHRVYIKGLKPGRTYQFQVNGFDRVYNFRTVSKDKDAVVRFAIGGDTMHRKFWMDSVNLVARSYDPDFIVWGGDLAYANGSPDNIEKWYQWHESIMETLIDSTGRAIPILLGIGNHEVQKKTEEFKPTDEMRLKFAPFFYSFFAFPGQPGYAAIDFGKYLSLIFLDTDHTNPIEGEQTEWLEKTLKKRKGFTHMMPVYHVPGFPSNRDFEGKTQREVRTHFVPLFEEYGVEVAFEHHDHTYKRTHPIRNGQIVPDEEGIVYLGDGAWGVGQRKTNDAWYLARRESKRHCMIVTLQGKSVDVVMVDMKGDVFDRYSVIKK